MLWVHSYWVVHHTKKSKVLPITLWILLLSTSAYVSDAQHHLFSCWLLTMRHDITILYIILLWSLFFPLSHDASPPVVSRAILNLSTRRSVTSDGFSRVSSSSTIIRLHVCCSLFNIVRMMPIIPNGHILEAMDNIQILFCPSTYNCEHCNEATDVGEI